MIFIYSYSYKYFTKFQNKTSSGIKTIIDNNCKDVISSHVKRTSLLWLHNKSRLSQHGDRYLRDISYLRAPM